MVLALYVEWVLNPSQQLSSDSIWIALVSVEKSAFLGSVNFENGFGLFHLEGYWKNLYPVDHPLETGDFL